MMPGLTGTETYERMARAAPETARKVTFMTGGAVTEAAQEQLDGTLCPCLEKPFDAQELLAFVRAHLG
jgi:DNA-binding response OmpR family regulator